MIQFLTPASLCKLIHLLLIILILSQTATASNCLVGLGLHMVWTLRGYYYDQRAGAILFIIVVNWRLDYLEFRSRIVGLTIPFWPDLFEISNIIDKTIIALAYIHRPTSNISLYSFWIMSQRCKYRSIAYNISYKRLIYWVSSIWI